MPELDATSCLIALTTSSSLHIDVKQWVELYGQKTAAHSHEAWQQLTPGDGLFPPTQGNLKKSFR